MKMIRNSIQKFRSKPLEGLVAILIGLQVISVVQNIQMVSRVNAAMAVFDGANLAQAAQILSSSKETLGVLGEVLDTNEALLGSFGVGDILSAVDKASYAVDLASQGPLAGVQELVGRTVPEAAPFMKLTRIGQNVIENGGVSAITPENVGTVVSTVFGPRVNPLDQRMAAKAYSTDATIRAIEQNMLARQTLAYNAGEIAEMSTRALQSAGTGGNYRKQMAVLTQAILSNSRYLLENTQTVLSEQEREISRDLEVRVEDGSLPWLRDKSAGETQQAVNEEEELPWLEDQESSSLTTPGTTIDK